MNDEIKEVLEDIDNKECYYVGTNGCLYQDLTKEELLLIKDYITNLQQENKKLKLKLYNVIEFVETNPLIWKPNMELTNLIENPDLEDILYYTPYEWLHKLRAILKGDDENEK